MGIVVGYTRVVTHSGRQIVQRKSDGTAVLWESSVIRPEVKGGFDKAASDSRRLNRKVVTSIKGKATTAADR